MAGRIPEELIDTIRAQADIVDFISEYVSLKRSGKNYLGLCPFHNEKTPSFNVNPERQIFHCFGCGKGGNVFSFLMEHEKITFVEAARHVAARLNIAIPDSGRERTESSEAENLARVTGFAAKFFHERLLASGPDTPVRRYVERRGISDATAHTFSLGYAPDAWDSLLEAARRQDIGPEWLEKAGLAKNNGGRFYDAFRNRLMFPIFSQGGRVVGFGGRALTDEDQPKYLNSPESPIYQKSRVVYGLHQAREAIRRESRVLIVEGYLDLISLYQNDVQAVVATCGTALTREHARLLARYAGNVILIYDADTAGIRAAMRGIEPLVEAGLWTRILQLPEGEDPDTFVRNHSVQSFLDRLEQSSAISDFIAGQFDLSRAESREEALRTLAGFISRTANIRHRERYIEEAYSRLPLPQSLLSSVLKTPDRIRRDYRTPDAPPRLEDPERELLRLALIDDQVAFLVEEHLHPPQDFTNGVYGAIMEQRLETLGEDGPSDAASLVDRASDAEAAHIISELVAQEDSGADRERRARDYIVRIQRERIKRDVARVKDQIKSIEQTGGDGLAEALTALHQLMNAEKELMQSFSSADASERIRKV